MGQRQLLIANLIDIPMIILVDCNDGCRLNLSLLPNEILTKILQIVKQILHRIN